MKRGTEYGYLRTGRPVAKGMHGAIASPHYLATQAGKNILMDGGHAVEAAIACNVTLCVVYPHMAGLGGDLFALVWDKNEQEVKAIDGSGRSGVYVTKQAYADRGLDEIPSRGPLAANTVPGTVDAWWKLHQRYGRLKWEQLFATAINYAKKGFPVSGKFSRYIESKQEVLEENANCAKVFLKDSVPLQDSDVLVQPDLAWSLEQIAKNGRDAFYEGEIADKIVASMEKHGGLLTKEDLEKHSSTWEEPISTTYRGYEVYEVKPNTQGIAALMMLNMIEQYDLTEIGDGTPDYFHLMAEAAKLNYHYRDKWIASPLYKDIPYNELLSKDFSKKIASHYSWEEAFDTDNLEKLPTIATNKDTTFTCVTDEAGNSISLIQSIYHEFGSAFMPDGCGFLLENRGASFSLDDEHPNTLRPDTRPFHTLIPGMVMKNEKPYMLLGTMGGEGQPQTQCAMITRVIDFGYNIQQAIEAPRWLYGRMWGSESRTLKLENRISDPIIAMLGQRGHDIDRVSDYSQTMGHAQGIVINQETGVYSAGADPRGDGLALSW
ncbi:gamma-glutamyltransferase [Aciduricibacillus chroicocephali]|uniref:Glutathione hydrolase proenzyme n=1 Tax=Aciduricibacillus chroicocephali TaxID=3054939 RepID=A0ABY9KY89_9BACI|nr:gamma-glutamyltransferase [Bacillaceae bacterium 44XB]